MPFIIFGALVAVYFITSSKAGPDRSTTTIGGRALVNAMRAPRGNELAVAAPSAGFVKMAPIEMDPTMEPLAVITDSGCVGGLPMATGDTDFTGLPPEMRSIYEEPMTVNEMTMPPISRKPTVAIWRNLASQLECAGYTAAAKKLRDKADTSDVVAALGGYS